MNADHGYLLDNQQPEAPRRFDALATLAPTLEVRRHDGGQDPTPPGGFDLAQARLVLVHVPERDRALASMVESLRPGGWRVVEDADPALQPLICPDEFGPE